MRQWEKRADQFAPLLEKRPTRGVDRDIARASFFQLHPHWESDVREASSHVIAFARRYAEQGEYDVSAIALNGLLSLNSRYISVRGDTFFGSNPFFTNPLSSEAFITDTLERLRRLALSAQGRSDEEQFIQVMTTLAKLCSIYAQIDGPVPELFRSFESILCNKGDLLWDEPEAKNFDKKRCVLH